MHQQLSKKKQKHHINFYFFKFYEGIKLNMSYLPLFPPPDYCALHNLLPLFFCRFCDNLLSLVRAPHMCMDVEVIYPRMKYPPVVTSINEEQFSISVIWKFHTCIWCILIISTHLISLSISYLIPISILLWIHSPPNFIFPSNHFYW